MTDTTNAYAADHAPRRDMSLIEDAYRATYNPLIGRLTIMDQNDGADAPPELQPTLQRIARFRQIDPRSPAEAQAAETRRVA